MTAVVLDPILMLSAARDHAWPAMLVDECNAPTRRSARDLGDEIA